jgi:hypothetical protein
MADQLVDSFTPSGPSATSILSKLPTKRLDAVITEAAESDIPEQGEQTGGYTQAYAHLSHLPLFPLYTQDQLDLLAKKQAMKERKVKHMDANDPDKLLSNSQKATLSVMGHLSGAGSVVGVKRFERRLQGVGVVASNFTMEQNKLVVFTRWTVPALPTPWFVDIIEHRFLDPKKGMGGNNVLLKAGLAPSGTKKDSKVTLKLLKTDAKGLKSQKLWTKRWNFDPCEAVVFVGDDGKELPMEIVARLQRACSTVEAHEMLKRFDKQWVVPLLQ